ncbi:hypothetical protein C1H46_027623 [Malus baccata]|uniref:Mitochondrial import inner membrane translocase subunit Tim16 n=1 Tax=Malus baccata TaxID=106549 RepID=A0A540LKL0_MALBA|nr:hypothetical protein C1H46_027623 [Malus baccata]
MGSAMWAELCSVHTVRQSQGSCTFVNHKCMFYLYLKINFFMLSLNADASKNGVANEAVNNIRRASKIMAEQEARQVLGVTEHASWEEILQRYDNLFERNAKKGSFYLQSKVHRAKEVLEGAYAKRAQGTPDA